MKPASVGASVLLASALACGHTPTRTASPSPPDARRGSDSSRRGPAGPVVGEYAVRYDGQGELRVEATLDRSGRVLTVERGVEDFVDDLEIKADGAEWTRGERDGRSFLAAPCELGPCSLRYRVRLRAAARAIGDLDVASEEGEVIEAPPSSWLLAPERRDGGGRVRFRVETTESTRFCTGVLRSREIEGAWDIALGDLWTSPYSVFGPLRVRALEESGGAVELAIAPGALAVSDDDLADWTRDSARAVAGYFGRFPLAEALVLVVPSRGRWIGEGKTLSGGGGAIFIRVGEHAPKKKLHEDWVLVHEMTHLAFPTVAREHDWAEEGLATYVEPFARARAGILSIEDAWLGLADGLPNGLPTAGDRGLDRTPTWGRTYWGGALFYLLADVEIRKRTQGRFGLEHALRAILTAGGDNAHRWALDDAFDVGDRATGVPVLRELHRAMGTSPHPVDLDALWRELGVVRASGAIRFDDAAPLAAIRRAITTPDPRGR
ncbi:MAG: hypothetical protein KF795_10250 [Labilithrix sp.]|nr:hypothetical protein [Labilithrix sp.]